MGTHSLRGLLPHMILLRMKINCRQCPGQCRAMSHGIPGNHGSPGRRDPATY